MSVPSTLGTIVVVLRNIVRLKTLVSCLEHCLFTVLINSILPLWSQSSHTVLGIIVSFILVQVGDLKMSSLQFWLIYVYYYHKLTNICGMVSATRYFMQCYVFNQRIYNVFIIYNLQGNIMIFCCGYYDLYIINMYKIFLISSMTLCNYVTRTFNLCS